MDPESKKTVTVRVHEGHDLSEWGLFSPDGTLIEGWHHLSVGRDHSGRFSLQVTFDQFDCVNAEDQPMGVYLTCPTAKHHEELPPLPSARMHKGLHK